MTNALRRGNALFETQKTESLRCDTALKMGMGSSSTSSRASSKPFIISFHSLSFSLSSMVVFPLGSCIGVDGMFALMFVVFEFKLWKQALGGKNSNFVSVAWKQILNRITVDPRIKSQRKCDLLLTVDYGPW